jgi:uracil-xanthine permease
MNEPAASVEVDESPLDIGVDEKVKGPTLAVLGVQHLLAVVGIWIYPILIGAALALSNRDVSHIIQACFLMTGIVTIMQSSKILRLPVVQGPTASFFAAIVAVASTYDLGVAFGSMMVAGLIFMALTIPVGRFGLFGYLLKFTDNPLIFGTLFLIIGAQLTAFGVPDWFGTKDSPGFGWTNFTIGALTMVAIACCVLFGGRSLVKRCAIVIGIVIGCVVAAIAGTWAFPDLSDVDVLGLPQLFPFGFGVAWPAVGIMLLAYLHAGTEAMALYTLVARWGKQTLTRQRINRGLFSEFAGTIVGAACGGVGTTTYPENAGIIRVTRVGSRYVTMTAGVLAVILAFLPKVSATIAALPGPVLAGACTILFGIIAASGVQMMRHVVWDDLNIIVAAVSFSCAIGSKFLSDDVVEMLPTSIAKIVTTPMLIGIIMLIVLNILVNFMIRPMLERRKDGVPGSVSDEQDNPDSRRAVSDPAS